MQYDINPITERKRAVYPGRRTVAYWAGGRLRRLRATKPHMIPSHSLILLFLICE